jgi:putative spermidine/putrescine transport system substrate-binding protein
MRRAAVPTRSRGRRLPSAPALAALVIVLLCLPAAALGGPSATVPPTKLGKSEGALSLLALPGYTDKRWVTPFERQTGCTVSVRTSSLADEITTVMGGGGSGIDVVAAPGDAALRLVAAGDVAPVNVRLVPGWRQFHAAFKSPQTNTVGGTHYGIAAQFSPNVLLYDGRRMARPGSWAAIYSPQHTGRITVPDDPMFIADAALYLAKAKPALGIVDPYELTTAQLAAAVQLLRAQRPLLSSAWPTASDEIEAFRSGVATIGAGWLYQLAQLRKVKPAVKATVPKEGVTGWLDSWMISVKAAHPNCAYRWLAYVSTPKVQAELATSYGATPVNAKACAAMDKLEKRSCAAYRADAPASYYRAISLWKAPVPDCGDDRGAVCKPYAAWVRAWADLKKS